SSWRTRQPANFNSARVSGRRADAHVGRPALASATAVARPMPLEHPVTNTASDLAGPVFTGPPAAERATHPSAGREGHGAPWERPAQVCPRGIGCAGAAT